MIDCGNGVARQMVLAKLDLGSIRAVFLTHHHSDYNADYGTLLLLAWATNLASRVDAYGPPPLAEMTRSFLALNEVDISTRIAGALQGRHVHTLYRPASAMTLPRLSVPRALRLGCS